MHQWKIKNDECYRFDIYLEEIKIERERKNGIYLKPTMKINVFYCKRWVATRYHREKKENDLDFVFIGAIFISIKHFQC